MFMIFMGMDVNKIFGMFGDDDRKSKIDEIESLKRLEDYHATPTYKIGMFKKMLLNHNTLKDKLINIFKTPTDEFNVKEMEEVGEYLAYNRAWEYISECKLEEELWQDSLTVMDDDRLQTALKMSIHYFEEREEYEKCALLKKIELFLEDNLD